MDRETELELLDEVQALRRARRPSLAPATATSPVARYLDPARFDAERRMLHAEPQWLAHSGELAEPGAYVRRVAGGRDLVLMRGDDGQVRTFANVCRHRATRLLDGSGGCVARVRCPYHGWTWDLRGRLTALPGRADGFPSLDDASTGLISFPTVERAGGVWVGLQPMPVSKQAEQLLTPVEAELSHWGLDAVVPVASHDRVWRCNWKLMAEGGLESYHFAVAHADSIAAMFVHNGSIVQRLGRHFRVVIPRTNLHKLDEIPRNRWKMRKCCNILYYVFPNLWVLVQYDHIVLFSFGLEAVDRTAIRLMTLRPDSADPATQEELEYWQRHHAITTVALDEDFGLAERIQEGLQGGVTTELLFGRFEAGPALFHEMLEEQLSDVGAVQQ